MIIKNNLNSFTAPFVKYYFNHPEKTFVLTIVAFVLILIFCFAFAKAKNSNWFMRIGLTGSVIFLAVTLTASLTGAWNTPSPIIYQPMKKYTQVLPSHSIYQMVPGLDNSNLKLENQAKSAKYVLTSSGLAMVTLDYYDYNTAILKPMNMSGKALINVIKEMRKHKDCKPVSLNANFKQATGECEIGNETVTITATSANPNKIKIKTNKKN